MTWNPSRFFMGFFFVFSITFYNSMFSSLGKGKMLPSGAGTQFFRLSEIFISRCYARSQGSNSRNGLGLDAKLAAGKILLFISLVIHNASTICFNVLFYVSFFCSFARSFLQMITCKMLEQKKSNLRVRCVGDIKRPTSAGQFFAGSEGKSAATVVPWHCPPTYISKETRMFGILLCIMENLGIHVPLWSKTVFFC